LLQHCRSAALQHPQHQLDLVLLLLLSCRQVMAARCRSCWVWR
jgi:hypothetical protein